LSEEKHESFASMMSTFGKLIEIESKIDMGIQQSKVPWGETRKFLKGRSQAGIMNTPLYQYMESLFYEIGLGTLQLDDSMDFRYLFTLPDCKVCALFDDIENKRVCTPVVEALARFFHEDLNISCNVKETECKNMEADSCKFLVELEPLSVYQILLDDFDMQILSNLSSDGKSTEELCKVLGKDPEEIQYILDILKYYQIIDKDNKLTDAGEAYKNFIETHPPEKMEEFDPPWKAMEKISSAIAATQSFAEAMVEVTEEDGLPWKLDEAEIIDLKQQAKDKKGFGEFLSDFSKEEDEEE
jgi:predicted hydrocarbon binding protein